MADTAPAPVPVFKKRGAKSSVIRKRPATPASESDSQSDYSESEDESGKIIKRRKIGSGVVRAGTSNDQKSRSGNADDLKSTRFQADTSTALTKSEDAIKQSHWIAIDAQAKALNASNEQPQKSIGPQKTAANVRTITITDFAPDVCKDYKQTGFCGFGDSCKFLHMREDYKQGWQLDKDWEKAGGSNKQNNKSGGGQVMASATARRKARMEGLEDEQDEGKLDELLKDIPFACVICKQPYKFPIVTNCEHFFCEKCALTRYKKNPTCAICGGATEGSFNGAKDLQRLLDKKQERAKKRKEAARAAGEDVSDDEHS